MINIDELRRNNIVWENYGGFYRVFGIKDNGKVTISKTESTIKVDFKDFDLFPVELSEEILLKCPQTKKDGDAIILMDRFRFVWKPQYKYWYVLTKDYFEYLTKIEFVHELQNFVYPLSGTELEINL